MKVLSSLFALAATVFAADPVCLQLRHYKKTAIIEETSDLIRGILENSIS